MVDGIPTSDHNEALSGDTLYSAFLNHEWREIVVAAVIEKMTYLASTITDETELQAFEVRYGALIDDLYNEEIVDGTPVGALIAYSNPTVPAKYLACIGQQVAQATYPELYALIATQFGAADAGNFKLPDMRQKYVEGYIPGGNSIGQTGGQVNYVLTEGNIPLHSHTVPAHAHSIATADAVGSNVNRVARGGTGGLGSIPTDTEAATETDSYGQAEPFPVQTLPPFVRFFWIIKALP